MEVKKKRVETEKNETGVVLGLEERPRSSPHPTIPRGLAEPRC